MKTYNGISVPPLIKTDRIISAFANPIDEDKVEEYTNVFKQEMLSHDFPPIKGYPHILTDEDVADNVYFLNGDEVMETHIGQLVWYVTDGHHRSISAINAELPHLPVELDYSTITIQSELNQ